MLCENYFFVYINVLVFFLNAYLHVNPKIPLWIEFILIKIYDCYFWPNM